MKNASMFLPRALRGAAFAFIASVSGVAMAQTATFDADCVPQLSGVQQRLYAKAGEGPDALREFMFIRRGILQLDIYETGVWADSVRDAGALCVKRLAGTRSVPSPALQMATAGASAPLH